MRILLTFIGLIFGLLSGVGVGAQTSPQRLVVVPAGGTGTYVGTAGLVSAITTANGMSGNVAVVIYAGTYTLDATHLLPIITKTSGLTIEGEGRGVQIALACDPAVTGRVFTVRGSYIDIRNLTLAYNPSCTSYTDVPFGIESGNDIYVSNITLTSPTGLTAIGTATTSAARVTFRDIAGPNWKSTFGLPAISIVSAQELMFDNVLIFGSNACTATTRALSIIPVALTDTVVFRRVEIFTSAGCPKLVTIDFSNGPLEHLWIDDSVFDSSTVRGMEIISSGTNPTFMGDIRVRNTSINAQSGGTSLYIGLTNAAGVVQMLEFDHNMFVARGNPVIVLDSASTGTIRSLRFDGNDINFATTGWSGPGVAVQLGMDNFSFIGNHNTAQENGAAAPHPGSIFFQTTKPVANGIIQGNFSSIATTMLDVTAGAITPSAISGNLP